MAISDFATLNPALEQFLRKKVVGQTNRSSVTADLIPKRVGMGKNLAWDVSIGTATGQVFDDGQIITVFNADVEVPAILPWAEYGDALKITGLAEDVAAFSNTEMGQLWVKKLMQTRERVAKRINDDVWVGDGTPGPQKIFGLTSASGPLDATGTYASVSRVTYPQWSGNVLANGGIPRGISLGLIEYGFEQVFNASGKVPNYGLTTANIWRMLCELADDAKRINQEIVVRGQKLNISMGYNYVEINGVPVFKDISVPAGTLAFFHQDSIAIEYLPPAAARVQRGKIMATVPIAGLPQEQSMEGAPEAVPLTAYVLSLPAPGNFECWSLHCPNQLACERPNAMLLIKDIAFRAE